jgi:hypothetical protein
MLLKAIATVLLFAASAFARSNPKKCAKELQSITYIPGDCSYNYLRRAAAAFPSDDPAFWTSNITAVADTSSADPSFNALMLTFERIWGVSILLTLLNGTQFYYNSASLTNTTGTPDTPGNFLGYSPHLFTHDLDQSNLNLGGYTSNLVVPASGQTFESITVDSYTFLAFNDDGQFRYVSLWLLTSSANDLCCKK